VFDGCTALNTIYVPTNKVNVYKDADNWKGYAGKIKGFNEIDAIGLGDNADNSGLIAAFNGETIDVSLRRTLYKDGDWNTLCLPFDVSTTSGPLSGDGVVAMTLNKETSGLSGSTLTLNFTSATSIPAGTPFIIKWNNTDDTDYSIFHNVTIDATNRDVTSTDGTVSFKGTYAPIVWETENKSILFLGAENKLYYPLPDLTDAQNPKYPHLNAFRAYFQIGDGTSAAPQLTAINLNFDGETTEITTTDFTDYTDSTDAWYDMQGRKLDSKPTQKGLYIHNGKKIVIK
jgi:hypothetical protein